MKIDNENFIQQLRLHNEDALMYVIDEYGGLLKSVITKHMPCLLEHQEECLNDVLLAIWNHSHSFHPEKNSFKNWVAAIAKYKSIDYMRKYQKELSNLSYEDSQTETVYIDHNLEASIETELSEKTQELLSCLKEPDREIFIGLYVNEEPIEIISNKLGLNKSAIYNRISRARKKLKKIKERKNYGNI